MNALLAAAADLFAIAVLTFGVYFPGTIAATWSPRSSA